MLTNSAIRFERQFRLPTDEVAPEFLNDDEIVAEVIAGLNKSPKELSSKWFYDEAGSALFDMICELPEYYPTRTELSIMRRESLDMARRLGVEIALIEFGSGTSLKTRLLLDRLEAPSVYVPIDIACTHLLDAASSIARDYPWLSIAPLCADFTAQLTLPKRVAIAKRKVIYFPGSTIGNFDTETARRLLSSMRLTVGDTGAALVGVDLKKDVWMMERAYNDARGITAKFNLNALRHLNRSLLTDFDLSAFEHRAVWVEAAGRIEMRLISKRDQKVHVDGRTIPIANGEYIRTEYSHKYTLEGFAHLAESAGFAVKEVWCDSAKKFSVQLLEPIVDPSQTAKRFLSL